MPPTQKRSRATDNDRDRADGSPSRTTPLTRRAAAAAAALPAPTPSPARPIATRSATSSSLSTQLSAFGRRTNSISSLTALSPASFASPMPPAAPVAVAAGTGAGTAAATRTPPALSRAQSMPVKPTPGKSDGENGGRRWGRGKENIPPAKKDDDEGARKRVRVGSRPASVRGRSGSVASVRSETSGRPSLGPSTSFSDLSMSRSSFHMPSPSPSLASLATPSLDSISACDPFEDTEATPTKGKNKRAVPAQTALPTPPPSSPPVDEAAGATTALGAVTVDARRSRTRSPTPGPRLFANAYRQLKSFLRLSAPQSADRSDLSAVDTSIVGRDDEKAVISSYLSLVSSQDVGMYISGPPGTGKTALVGAVGRELAKNDWHVVELGMTGVKVGDIWHRLGEELGCETTEEAVRARLADDNSKTYIVLDEVDSLLPPAPSHPLPATSHALSKLFSLPRLSGPRNTVKLVAISNTLDLTVRANLVLPEGAMPQVLAFRAYGAPEMAAIVSARLASFDDVKVDTKAVELLCKKVEAQNGDLRMCLGVLSSAVGLAEADWAKKQVAQQQQPGHATPLVKVALPHILKAFTSHTSQLKAAAGSGAKVATTATGRKILSVPVQGKMVLLSMLVFLARTRAGLPGCPAVGSGTATPTTKTPGGGKDEALTPSSLYATYAHLLSHGTSPFPPAPESDYRDLLSNLEDIGLVALPSGSGAMTRLTSGSRVRGQGGRIEVMVREEEIVAGLGLCQGDDAAAAGSTDAKGLAEQEVARVWVREEAKIRRVRERAERAADRAELGMDVDA
ncbi:AAA ATPase [Cryptotrichosporon argae]